MNKKDKPIIERKEKEDKTKKIITRKPKEDTKVAKKEAKKEKPVKEEKKAVKKVEKKDAAKPAKTEKKAVKKETKKVEPKIEKKVDPKPTVKKQAQPKKVNKPVAETNKKVDEPAQSKKEAPKKKVFANNENVKPAVVPAEMGEIKKPKHNKIKKHHPKRRMMKTPRNPEETVHKISAGDYSEEIQSEKLNKKSQKEIDSENFKKLSNYKRTNEILWGTVISISKSEKEQVPYIKAIWNGYEVMIPFEWYFEKNYDFGTTFAKETKEGKYRRMKYVAEFQLDAIICFVVKGLSWKPEKDGNRITIVGSRSEAMELQRRIYFFERRQRPIEVGNIIEDAHVIAVKEDNVLVECRGVETRINAYQLNYEWVTNCQDYCKPGDIIPVKVKRLDIKDGNVNLVLTGRLEKTSQNIKYMKEGDVMSGVVDTFNRNKHDGTYSIILKNKVRASVRQKDVMGNIDLVPGNRVSVTVLKIMDEFVIGQCKKIY